MSLGAALAMIEPEDGGEDLTWKNMAFKLDFASIAYRKLQPPPKLREFHDAQLRALTGFRDFALTRLGYESFSEEFALAFTELFAVVFEIAFDAEKTEEEQEMLIEEATKRVFATIFGPTFLETLSDLEEIESQISEDVLAVLDDYGCRFTASEDSWGEDQITAEVATVAPEVIKSLETVVEGEDDHGDDVDSATAMWYIESLGAMVDHGGDVDYFVFEAVEGEVYQIDVSLGTLGDSTLTLYDADGWLLAHNDNYDDNLASRIVWEAPSSGSFYVAAGGYGTGSYTLTISAPDGADDHGNDRDSATAVAAGGSMVGALEHDGDLDWFVFEAQAGEIYELDISLGSLLDASWYRRDSDGFLAMFSDDYCDTLTFVVCWEAPSSGSYYVVVGGNGTGSYVLTVSLSDATQPAVQPTATVPSDSQVLLGFNIAPGSLWKEAYDAFSPVEQTCIRNEFGDDLLNSALNQPIDGDEDGLWSLSTWECLQPETASSLYFSLLLILSLESLGLDPEGASKECIGEVLAGTDLAAIFAASLSDAGPDGTAMTAEFDAQIAACL